MSNKTRKVHLIIHSFAAAHAVAALVLLMLGWGDDLVLTILTIVMVFAIANVYKLPIDVTATNALLVCFAGFFIGTKGVELCIKMFGSMDGYNIAITAIATEILGWATYFIARGSRFKRK